MRARSTCAPRACSPTKTDTNVRAGAHTLARRRSKSNNLTEHGTTRQERGAHLAHPDSSLQIGRNPTLTQRFMVQARGILDFHVTGFSFMLLKLNEIE